MHAQSPKTYLPTASVALAVVAILLLTAFGTLPAQGQTLKVLYSFTRTGRFLPYAPLLYVNGQGLYGATWGGGINDAGTIFKVYNDGRAFALYSFGGDTGSHPFSALIEDAAGNFYGTTSSGAGTGCSGFGCGAVFKVDASTGAVTVLHQFLGYPDDGGNPQSGLVMDSLGNFYGTTFSGGAANIGTVYKIDPSGTETVLHTFRGSGGGGEPVTGLALDSSGNLYGTTSKGGKFNLGVVFKVDPSGTETVLHIFSVQDGYLPDSTLIVDDKGNLYGTAARGGAGSGTVWEIAPSGNFTVLYTFTGFADGSFPEGGLIRDGAGHLYGTTENGGAFDCGTIYRLNGKNDITVLHSFDCSTEGSSLVSGLTTDKKGDLFGTAQRGGIYDNGTVFELVP